MIKPPLLSAGSTIAIVAPARKVNKEQVHVAVEIFQRWGLTVLLGKNLFSNSHAYLGGSDEERFADLQEFINNPNVNAIISARGGYGSTRILDQLDFSTLIIQPKWLIGFSDITAMHLKTFKSGVCSIHGTMPVLFNKKESEPSINSLYKILFEGKSEIDIQPNPFNRAGKGTAQVVGGNLSLIVDSLGTSTEINTEEKILVLEEIDEYIYRLDRMITQLKRAGKLARLKGLIIGHMTDIKESELPFRSTFEEIILNATKEYIYPVAFNMPIGHENPNIAWIHGDTYEYNVSDKDVSLRLISGLM